MRYILLLLCNLAVLNRGAVVTYDLCAVFQNRKLPEYHPCCYCCPYCHVSLLHVPTESPGETFNRFLDSLHERLFFLNVPPFYSTTLQEIFNRSPCAVLKRTFFLSFPRFYNNALQITKHSQDLECLFLSKNVYLYCLLVSYVLL